MTRVVFYARVSTEHEKQISALDNQIEWYRELIAKNKEWKLVDCYIDEGLTGTSADKRKEFQRMMKDGIENHEFDLIITREVSRFARNTVDTLQWSRRLLAENIRVYFVNDNIDTGKEDGELRLSIMSTLAQDESRKISSRVKAGLKIARNRGTILGTGNILGYDRTRDGEFIINPEQAETIKLIYKWYLEGNGIRKIKTLLEQYSRKSATGKVKWDVSAISRVLSNPMYTGYQYQQQSISDGYLTQKRKKQGKEEFILVKGKHEPIITKEIYDKVQEIKKGRMTFDTSQRPTGRREVKDIWARKLICGCGSRYKTYHWRADVYGYSCWEQTINGKKSFREKKGLSAEGACELPSICDWKLEMMMWKVIKRTWTTGQQDIENAFHIIKECYQDDKEDNTSMIQALKAKLEKLEKRKNSLIDMRADWELGKEDFHGKMEECERETGLLETQLADLEGRERQADTIDEKMDRIKEQLDQMIDFSTGKIEHELLEGLLARIVHIGDYEFDVYLNLGMGPEDYGATWIEEEKEIKIKQFNVKGMEVIRERHIKLFDMKIDFNEAQAYRKMFGKYLREKQWKDMDIHVYL